MKNEDINKQKEDFNFVEDLKIKREEEMKKQSELEKDMSNDIRNELFDISSTVKEEDPTPTIITDTELTIENIPPSAKIQLQYDLGFDNPYYDNFSTTETENIPTAEVVKAKNRKIKTPEELQMIEEKKAIAQAKKAQEKAETKAKIEAKKAQEKAEKEAKKAQEKAEKAQVIEKKKQIRNPRKEKSQIIEDTQAKAKSKRQKKINEGRTLNLL
jgi:hypothetical protein